MDARAGARVHYALQFDFRRDQRPVLLRFTGCWFVPVPLSTAPIPLRKPRARHERASAMCRKSGGLPSAARRRALRSGCVLLCAPVWQQVVAASQLPCRHLGGAQAPQVSAGTRGAQAVGNQRQSITNAVNRHVLCKYICVGYGFNCNAASSHISSFVHSFTRRTERNAQDS